MVSIGHAELLRLPDGARHAAQILVAVGDQQEARHHAGGQRRDAVADGGFQIGAASGGSGRLAQLPVALHALLDRGDARRIKQRGIDSTTESRSRPARRRIGKLADRIERARGRHWARIIPFARSTRVAAVEERVKSNWQLRHTAGPAGHGTNLEAAIRDGAAALPAGMVPRLVLVSDGKENLGSASRAIWQAQQLGVPVDTIALPGRPKPGLVLESVTFPGQVFSGERFPIEVALAAPRAAAATVDMTAEGKSIGSNKVNLAAGLNRFRLQATVNSVGAIALAGKISAEGLGRRASRTP